MPHPKTTPEAMREIQDSIYREKVLRARSMTPLERFEGGMRITNSAMKRMLDGAMDQKGISDKSEGWAEVRHRLERLSRIAERGFFVTQRVQP